MPGVARVSHTAVAPVREGDPFLCSWRIGVPTVTCIAGNRNRDFFWQIELSIIHDHWISPKDSKSCSTATEIMLCPRLSPHGSPMVDIGFQGKAIDSVSHSGDLEYHGRGLSSFCRRYDRFRTVWGEGKRCRGTIVRKCSKFRPLESARSIGLQPLRLSENNYPPGGWGVGR